MKLKIKEVINSDLAISPEAGDKIFKLIVNELEKDNPVILDFSELDLMTTVFLNSAIGNLYSRFSSDVLNKLLKMENVPKADIFLIKEVVKMAKQKLEPSILEKILEEELG